MLPEQETQLMTMEDSKREKELDEFWRTAREGIDYYEDSEGFRIDVKESDPRYRDIIKKADKEAEEVLRKEWGANYEKSSKQLGYCYSIWGEKQKILKEKYNIDWKTPAEMNPDILFD